VNSQVLFQMYWSGDRDTMLARLARARDAGRQGIILTPRLVVRQRRGLGSPWIPDKIDSRRSSSSPPK